MRRSLLFLLGIFLTIAPSLAQESGLYVTLPSGIMANARYYSINPRLGMVWEFTSDHGIAGPAITFPPPGQNGQILAIPASPEPSRATVKDGFQNWDRDFYLGIDSIDRQELLLHDALEHSLVEEREADRQLDEDIRRLDRQLERMFLEYLMR